MVYSHALPKDEDVTAEIWDSAFRMDNGKEKACVQTYANMRFAPALKNRKVSAIHERNR
jgi:hypothetical protein